MIRRDAQRSVNKLSAIPLNIQSAIVGASAIWPQVDQFVRTVKPLVDAIGNLESRDTTLADCMLELIRCARTMHQLTLEDGEDVQFWLHAKKKFNERFHEMDSRHHTLALFLHPLCRRLAISQAAKGRTFEVIESTALEIAKQWRWSLTRAAALQSDLQKYHKCEEPFKGGKRDALEWWTNLSISTEKHPLKSLAIVLHSIVPHAGEIERVFSQLGGVQSAKRCQLSVETFEALGKIRANLHSRLQKKLGTNGASTRRKHAHMHTRSEPGIDAELAENLGQTFTWVPPMTIEGAGGEISLEGPESVSVEELDKAFREFEEQQAAENAQEEASNHVREQGDVLKGELYNFEELDKVDGGVIPMAVEEEVQIIGDEEDEGAGWTVAQLTGR